MNTPIKITALFFALFFFSSCEDVIELDLATSEPQLVIEGTLDAGTQIAKVVISQTNDFYDNAAPDKIADASVFLLQENGLSYELIETAAGTYKAENVTSSIGEEFTLRVEVDEKIYEASAKVPAPTSLDDIMVSEASSSSLVNGQGEGNLMLTARWEDPIDIESFYRIRTYVNDTLQSAMYTIIADSFLGDGEPQILPLRDRFMEGTKVSVELLSTNESYYNYFSQLSSIAGEGGAATTPYNPSSNFGESGLGYFGIYHSSIVDLEL